MNEAIEAIKPLVVVFDRLGIAYRVGGSLASTLHGFGRSTMAADLATNVQAQHAEAFQVALQGKFHLDPNLMLESLGRGQSFNLIDLEYFVKVDVFPLGEREYDQHSFLRVVEFDGINYITPEDTILRKLEWFLLSGGSERQWRDVIGVLQIQANALDWDYLRRWAKALDLTEALESVVKDAQKDMA